MNKKKFYIFFLILVLISSCSFDDKTGLWKGDKKEKERLSKLEKQQKEVINVKNIYSSDKPFILEKSLSKKIILSKAKNITDWKMHGLNHQNFLGNIFLTGIENNFGFLWGSEESSEITKEQQHMKDLYENMRSEILDRGNSQIRNLEAELSHYDITWKRYQVTLPVKVENKEEN